LSVKSCLLSCLLLASPAMALADPTGAYNLSGVNPDNGQKYTGTVEVTRTGETYSVSWKIGGSEFIGTGLGAKIVDGSRFEMGVASADDIAISVGYISGNSFGTAMYFEQPDGSWQGVWTYGGSKKASPETWTRMK